MSWSILPILTVLRALSGRRPHTPRRHVGHAHRHAGSRDPGAAAAVAPPLASADDGRSACGWFDSSHELSCGLRVTEHAQPEAVAQLVPLRWWLAWELDAASAAAPPIHQGRASSG